MRVMALHAIHSPFRNRVVLRQVKVHMNVQVTLITGFGIFPWIHNEATSSAPAGHMLAAGAVARFATGVTHLHSWDMNSRMRSGRKNPRDVGMTLRTHLVPDERSPFNFWRCNNGVVERGTGT